MSFLKQLENWPKVTVRLISETRQAEPTTQRITGVAKSRRASDDFKQALEASTATSSTPFTIPLTRN